MTRTHFKVSNSLQGRRGCFAPNGHIDIVQKALSVVNGRWKIAIISRLFEKPVLRFTEIEHDIAAVSQKVLAQHLQQLERDGVVRRVVHAQVPPRVDYSLTQAGEALRPALEALLLWGAENLRDREEDNRGVAGLE